MLKRFIAFVFDNVDPAEGGWNDAIKDKEGKVIDESPASEPVVFLTGVGQIIPGLEAEILTLKKGDKKNIDVPSAKAYGPYNQEEIFQVDRGKFPKPDIKVGDVFRIGQDNDFKVVTVVDLDGASVTLDANHPLAGKDLSFSVEIFENREATAEEMSHGHVHGEVGHHH